MSTDISVSVNKTNGSSNVKAMATVRITTELGTISIDGWKVVEGKNGIFAGAPSRKNADDTWADIVSGAKDDGFITAIKAAIVAGYEGGQPVPTGSAAPRTAPKTSVPREYLSNKVNDDAPKAGPRKAAASSATLWAEEAE